MTTRTPALLSGAAGVLLALGTAGCGTQPARAPAPSEPQHADGTAAERAKLGPADRALADAQEWCVISTDERLGSMGPPLKLTINGVPVFVCCKGCVRKAESKPDATLARRDELRAKAAARAP